MARPSVRLALVAVFAFCVPIHVKAEGRTVLGYGGISCGRWIEHNSGNEADKLAQGSWVIGYLTGVGEALDFDLMADTDAAGVDGWMMNYCTAHSLDTVYKAASMLGLEIAKRRLIKLKATAPAN